MVRYTFECEEIIFRVASGDHAYIIIMRVGFNNKAADYTANCRSCTIIHSTNALQGKSLDHYQSRVATSGNMSSCGAGACCCAVQPFGPMAQL